MFLLIDYRMGNLRSVAKALEKVGAAVTVRDTPPGSLDGVDAVVLPGVGHFAAAMHNLRAAGWVDFLAAARARDVPYLGLCLGLQVLYAGSDEAPGVAGLGVLPGHVAKFPADMRAGGRKLAVPHMGWNSVSHDGRDPLWAGRASGSYFYFVHSYYAPVGPETIGTCAYGLPFTAALRAPGLVACQFHPEKSQAGGLRLLANFVKEVRQ
ncbi:MAG: imidazole glycerol phosphate synthase, glutamine amidotransferase subunit [Verrucomicrobia bacterium GWF2_62_7]|nr:MAG: imidazole glycerol phosphate synthase, glutamine amidotransferase subunit [Verrucomicrobia bacterium GWF2_62_7]